MGHTGRNLEDGRAASFADYGGHSAQEASERNNSSMWTGGHPCGVLSNNMAASYPHPENFPEAKF